MKILTIDDQQLILLPIYKRLTEIGYEVETANSVEEGIKVYNRFNPDLVLLDMNMPEMNGKEVVEYTGIEVVKYIRVFLKKITPIIVVSGNTRETVIMENFNLGIDDYIKKPVGLAEMTKRIERIIGLPKLPEPFDEPSTGGILQKNCVGIIIPCHNQEERLLSEGFRNFIEQNHGYHFYFINNGSTDNTLQILYELQYGNESTVTIYDSNNRIGTTEALRQGILHLSKDPQLDYLGYLDVALSTEINNFDDLLQKIERSQFKIVSGGEIDGTFSMLAQKIFGMNFESLRYGSKIMNKEKVVFNKSYINKSYLNNRIFKRLREQYSSNKLSQLIGQ